MAKESGMAWTTCSVDDANGDICALVNDVTSLDFSTPRNLLDWTGLDKSAMERGLGLADFSITLNCIFNDAADKSWECFKDTTVERDVTLVISGQTLENDCYVSDASFSRASDGNFTIAGTLQLMDGVVPVWS
jgi:hypothetical protein